MIDFLHLGQGPRPDLLEQELKQKAALQKTLQEEAKRPSNAADSKKEKQDFSGKDIVAMIIAMFEVIAPWAAIGIFAYFIVVFLITRI